jgi:hypothetical protein
MVSIATRIVWESAPRDSPDADSARTAASKPTARYLVFVTCVFKRVWCFECEVCAKVNNGLHALDLSRQHACSVCSMHSKRGCAVKKQCSRPRRCFTNGGDYAGRNEHTARAFGRTHCSQPRHCPQPRHSSQMEMDRRHVRHVLCLSYADAARVPQFLQRDDGTRRPLPRQVVIGCCFSRHDCIVRIQPLRHGRRVRKARQQPLLNNTRVEHSCSTRKRLICCSFHREKELSAAHGTACLASVDPREQRVTVREGLQERVLCGVRFEPQALCRIGCVVIVRSTKHCHESNQTIAHTGDKLNARPVNLTKRV